ncbi:MAG TPA: gamma-glutamyltransferase family protein, partial [Longimicrobiales bacterium]|nr:gamma-glutamyltransferase family protein [Longimicrobiales bacterium]
GSGRAGSRATPALFEQRGLKQVPTFGILSVTVPGAVRAWADALKRFGTISLADALAPGIRYAERGYPLTPKFRADLDVLVDRVKADPELARTFLRDGKLINPGELIVQGDLARTMKTIAQQGPDGLYRGEVARRIADFMSREGGLITEQDLAAHESEWVNPLSTSYRGYRVLGMPPNSQGLAMLMQLNLAERLDLKAMGHNSAQYIHSLVEIKKAVFADRDRYIADPAFTEIPVQRLLSKEYAAERARALFGNATQSQIDHRKPYVPGGDTVFLCAVDKDGNAVVMIQSLFQFLGSGRVVPGTGILLHDRGTSFSLDPKHANVIAPRKRPYHTLTPHMVLNPDGTPFLLMGTPGGDGQTQTLMQAFHNLLSFGMSPQAAVEAPRFRSHEDLRLAVEPGISEAVRKELEGRGHTVVVRPPSEEFGGAQMILIHPVSKARIAGADMRREATALAW